VKEGVGGRVVGGGGGGGGSGGPVYGGKVGLVVSALGWNNRGEREGIFLR